MNLPESKLSTSDGSNGGGQHEGPAAKRKRDEGELSLESIPAKLIDLPPPDGQLSTQADLEERAFEAWLRGPHAQGREAAILASLRVCSRALARDEPSSAGLELVRQVMPNGPEAQVSALLCLTAMAFDAGQVNRFKVLLRESFRLLQQVSPLTAPLAPPDVMSRLCASALRLQIEPQAVRRAILSQGIRPACEQDSLIWPWPVRLQTLGRFGLVVAGEPIACTSPLQDKTQELLLRLVSAGGEGVDSATLTQEMGAPGEGDAPRLPFEDTVQHLRQLLGDNQTLRVNNGRLSLDPELCWVDAWSFERLTRGLSEDDDTTAGALDLDAANAAMGLYAGHFLESEVRGSWSQAYRDRLRERLHQLVRQVARQFESMGAMAAAASICERGLELDNTAEAIYQQLMICHLSRGDHARALKVYHRCRESLQNELGVTPSARTERLHHAATMPPSPRTFGRQASGPAAP